MKLCASHGTMANVFALYFYFATLAAIANTQSSSFVARKPVLRGFTGCREITVVDGKKVKKNLFISDQETKCQYWKCPPAGATLTSHHCALGTHIHEFYTAGRENPCTERHNLTSGRQFDCTRKGFDPNGRVECLDHYAKNVCKNGASVRAVGSLCQCICAPGFTGFNCAHRERRPTAAEAPQVIVENAEPTQEDDSDEGDDGVQVFGQPPRAIPLPDDDPGVDFSTVQVQDPPSALSASSPDKKAQSGGTQPGGSRPVPDPPQLVERAEVELPRRVVRIMPGQFLSDDPCPAGHNPVDFCATDPVGCLNGGVCINQCLNLVCACTPPYTAGARCEKYQCTTGVECLNGGTCSRGPRDEDPVATCQCPPGFSGPMCEIRHF